MIRKLLLLSIIPISTFGYSQTKLIAHKSHSGSKSNFNLAIANELFDIGESNFGMAPQRFVRNSNLDTVKLLSKNVAVMVTSESCERQDYHRDAPVSKEIWSAGTDTVYDHPVFNSKNSIEEIKTKLKNEYYFSNEIDKVVFIGFDGKYAIAKERQVTPEVSNQENSNRNSDGSDKKRPSFFMLIILSLLSTIFKTPF